jgi:hypothetical protein
VSKHFCAANPYETSETTAITYGLTRMKDGYVLQVVLPSKGHLSCSDQIKIIDWLHEYRNQVVRANPTWYTSFKTTENGYTLEIRPVKLLKDVACEGDRVREVWHRTFSNV